MNLEKLLGLNDGHLKRLADFYYPLENKDSRDEEMNARSTLIPNHKQSERNAFKREAREFASEVQP